MLESQRYGQVTGQVYAGTPHIFCLTTTSIIWVFCGRIGTQKNTRIYRYISAFRNLYVFNFSQGASITEICRIQVNTDTPHIFCLTTTIIFPDVMFTATRQGLAKRKFCSFTEERERKTDSPLHKLLCCLPHSHTDF